MGRTKGNGAGFGISRIASGSLYPDGKRPADAIEQMLYDQAAIAHHRLIRLQEKASKAKTLETAQVYNQAATRLMTEFRRFALAIRQYGSRRHTSRSPSSTSKMWRPAYLVSRTPMWINRPGKKPKYLFLLVKAN
jgi:hypothetical protein